MPPCRNSVPHWSITPIIKSFDHDILHKVVHAYAKFRGQQVQYKRVTIIFVLTPKNLAAALLLVGMRILVIPLIQWQCLSTTACFISLHTPLRNFVAIGFNIKEISFLLCSLSLLPCSRGAASWRVHSLKSVTPFVKSFYPVVYHEPAHASTNWFSQTCHDGQDFEVAIFVTLAVQTTMPHSFVIASSHSTMLQKTFPFASIFYIVLNICTEWIINWFCDSPAAFDNNLLIHRYAYSLCILFRHVSH